jgi:hypothetical protein
MTDWIQDLLDEINAVCERNRKDYEALAAITGMTIEELEADLTAPDPGQEE